MGRKAGTLMNCRCKICGAIEPASSAGGYFRCTPCRTAGKRVAPSKSKPWLDTDACCAIVAGAVRDGTLPDPHSLQCVDCGDAATEYDHRDYGRPLDVEPVCRTCNSKRGPAIPRPGSIHLRVARGIQPYRLRFRALQLFSVMGLPTDALERMPAKLTIDHWCELLPLIPQAAA